MEVLEVRRLVWCLTSRIRNVDLSRKFLRITLLKRIHVLSISQLPNRGFSAYDRANLDVFFDHNGLSCSRHHTIPVKFIEKACHDLHEFLLWFAIPSGTTGSSE